MSLHARFVAVMAFPWVSIAFIRLIQCIGDGRVARSGASGDALAEQLAVNRNKFAYRVFFVVFLCYPLLCKTVFHMFLCQTLGLDDRWHVDDFSIDCDSPMHITFTAIATVFIFVYPVGIPLTFVVLLRKDERKRKRNVYPARDADTPDDGAPPLSLPQEQEVGDEDLTQTSSAMATSTAFDFLRKDYKDGYYYFECVFLVEKLILTGLIIFLDPGGIFQAVCGTTVAFTFFTIEVVAWPYAAETDNYLKAAGEVQLFLTLLVSIVLQASKEALRDDFLSEAGYDRILVVTFFVTPLLFFTFASSKLFRLCCRCRRSKLTQVVAPVMTEASTEVSATTENVEIQRMTPESISGDSVAGDDGAPLSL
jgi:hypothetical protein